MTKRKPSLSNRLLKDLVTQVNRQCVAVERQIGAILTLTDIMERRDEYQYFTIKNLLNENRIPRGGERRKAEPGKRP